MSSCVKGQSMVITGNCTRKFPHYFLSLEDVTCWLSMISDTRLREYNPHYTRFPELRLVFADAREAYTGLRSNTPFGGISEGSVLFSFSLFVYSWRGSNLCEVNTRIRTILNRLIRGKVNQKRPPSGVKGPNLYPPSGLYLNNFSLSLVSLFISYFILIMKYTILSLYNIEYIMLLLWYVMN